MKHVRSDQRLGVPACRPSGDGGQAISSTKGIGFAPYKALLDPAKIAGLTLVGSGGQRIPLSQVGTVDVRMEDPILRRRDRTPTIMVRGDIAVGHGAGDGAGARLEDVLDDALFDARQHARARAGIGQGQDAVQGNAFIATRGQAQQAHLLITLRVQHDPGRFLMDALPRVPRRTNVVSLGGYRFEVLVTRVAGAGAVDANSDLLRN